MTAVRKPVPSPSPEEAKPNDVKPDDVKEEAKGVIEEGPEEAEAEAEAEEGKAEGEEGEEEEDEAAEDGPPRVLPTVGSEGDTGSANFDIVIVPVLLLTEIPSFFRFH